MKSFLLAAAALAASVSAMPNPNGPNPDEVGPYYQGDIMGFAGPVDRNGIIDERYRWPPSPDSPGAVVPYIFEEGNGFDDDALGTIMSAMQDYYDISEGCIQFVERTDESDYVVFSSDSGGCSSYVGRIGGGQTIYYNTPGCTDVYGTVQHEMYHALGFFHEQSRTDRDDYVEVHTENVDPVYRSNFDKYPASVIDPFGEEYDYGSVMHYSRFAFSNNGQQTLIPINPRGSSIGQREFLSTSDINKVLRMYNCPNAPAA